MGAPYLCASEIREAAPQIPILKPSEPQPTVHEPASARAVLPDIYASETVPSSAPDPDHLQQAAVDALMSAKSQATAGDAIADSEFSLTGSDLTIQTTFSKTMLPTVINPEAGKVLRAAIQSIASRPEDHHSSRHRSHEIDRIKETPRRRIRIRPGPGNEASNRPGGPASLQR